MSTVGPRKLFRFHIVVRGSGRFPLDMLRYDHCWPRTEQDSSKADSDWGGELREVSLLADHELKRWLPNIDRWKSFTWQVVSCSLEP